MATRDDKIRLAREAYDLTVTLADRAFERTRLSAWEQYAAAATAAREARQQVVSIAQALYDEIVASAKDD